MSTDQNDHVTTAVRVPTTEAIITATAARRTARTPLWRRLLRDPQAVIAASVLLIMVILGVLTPWIAPHDPNDAQLAAINAPPGTERYLLGADQNGRDILSRLLHSIGTSLVSGVIGAGVGLVIGVFFGLIGGYFGQRSRAATEWLFNLIMTFPGLLLLILLMPLTKGDYRWTMVIFGVLLAPSVYRIVRNLVLGVKNELFVDAARVTGLSNLRILGRHVLFVVRGPIIVTTSFLIGSAIATQAGLAFLGVGSKLIPSFGAMISDGFTNFYVASDQFVYPSIMLGLLTAALVLLGNALRDALEGAKPKPARAAAVRRARREATAPATGGGDGALVSVRDLAIGYPAPGGELREVVKGVSLDIAPGETLGLVGESGSGKTQTAFAILGVLPAEARVVRGSVRLEGRELLDLDEPALRALRGREIAYIPQEPMSNLDPSYTIGAQLVEGVRASARVSRAQARERVLALLERVGIPDPVRTFGSYPHQISGGMAQRVLIAGAVASRPKLLIADEPTTALDVTVQAEILDLLRDLQQELGMAVLLVTHNFGVVADLCDRIAVMQGGEIVETGDALTIFRDPRHPYTQMLLGSILDDDKVRDDAPPVRADETKEAQP